MLVARQRDVLGTGDVLGHIAVRLRVILDAMEDERGDMDRGEDVSDVGVIFHAIGRDRRTGARTSAHVRCEPSDELRVVGDGGELTADEVLGAQDRSMSRSRSANSSERQPHGASGSHLADGYEPWITSAIVHAG